MNTAGSFNASTGGSFNPRPHLFTPGAFHNPEVTAMPAARQAFATRAIHGGQQRAPTSGPTFGLFGGASVHAGQSPKAHVAHDDARSHNPTRTAFERAVADLEEGVAGFAFASGQAAIATVLELVEHGSHVLVCDDACGPLYRTLERVRRDSGKFEFSYVAPGDMEAIGAAIRPNTRIIWVESPTSPLLKLADLEAIARLAAARGIVSVADNTFATPVAQRPIELGFDVVVHSVARYLSGYQDIAGGVAIIGRRGELAEQMRALQNAGGASAESDCFLALRGLKTLSLRMERHAQNAQRIADWLAHRSDIERVYYPGLPSHPQHELARRQMRLFGGTVSMVVAGGLERARRVLERCRLFTLDESLGGVESLIEHPAMVSHAATAAAERRRIGIDDGLIRLSVGVEDLGDLVADLDQSLR